MTDEITVTLIPAELYYSTIPVGWRLVADYAVRSDINPSGAALVQHTKKKCYRMYSMGVFSGCDQHEAKRIDSYPNSAKEDELCTNTSTY